MRHTISLFSIIVLGISSVFAGWNVSVVDNGGQYSSLGIIQGQPAISYKGDNDALKYARYNGSNWVIQTVDDADIFALTTSLAQLTDGNPAIAYWEYMNDDLKYAWYDGSVWQSTIVESAGVTGKYTSMAIINGQPAISYYNSTTQELKYARFNGSVWQPSTVATGVSIYHMNTSIIALADGNPAIAYCDSSKLKYAWFNGTVWQTRFVDTSATVIGQYSSMVLLPSGRPAISYYDTSYKRLKYAALNASDSWDIAIVDDGYSSLNDFGKYSSLAILPNGNPAISYYDGFNESLRLAFSDNGVWTTMDVDGSYGSQAGMYSSLAVMPDNTLGISYYVGDDDVLKFARTDAPVPSALPVADYVATARTTRTGEDVGVNRAAYTGITYCYGGGGTFSANGAVSGDGIGTLDNGGNSGVYSEVLLNTVGLPGSYYGLISVSGQTCDTDNCIEYDEQTWECLQWQHIHEEPGDANGRLELHFDIEPSVSKPMGSASYLYIKPVLSGDDGGASETAYIKVYRNSVLIADEVDNMCIVVMTGDFIDIDAYLGVVGDDNYGRQMQLDIQLLDNRKMADICGDSLQAGPDGDVDFFDFAALAARWFDENCALPDFCSGADLNIDSVVDIFDLSILAGDWLKGIVYIAPPPTPFYEQNLDTNPGWTTEGLWSWGVPTGEGGSYGSPDPTSGYTGDNVYGYNLSGDYTDNMPATHLTSTAIDCTGRQNVHLLFWRWLGVESPDYDKASVAVSNDGVNWVTVWQNPNTETADSAWTAMEIDISAVADGRPTVYLRWTMGSTDSSVVYCGWNIDDIQLYEKP